MDRKNLEDALHNLSLPQNVFQRIADFFMTFEKEGVDVDDMPESLNILFPNKRVYLILFQGESQQFWISSPLCGGRHFFYDDKDHLWKDTRNGKELFAFLQEETLLLLGKK